MANATGTISPKVGELEPRATLIVFGFVLLLLTGWGYGVAAVIAELQRVWTDPDDSIPSVAVIAHFVAMGLFLIVFFAFTVYLLCTKFAPAIAALKSNELLLPVPANEPVEVEAEPEFRKRVTLYSSNKIVLFARFGWIIAGVVWVLVAFNLSRIIHAPDFRLGVVTAILGLVGALITRWMIRSGWKYAALSGVKVTLTQFPLRLPGRISGRLIVPNGMDVEDLSLSLICIRMPDLELGEEFLDDDLLTEFDIRCVRTTPTRFRFARRLSAEDIQPLGPHPDDHDWSLKLQPSGVTYRSEAFGSKSPTLYFGMGIYHTPDGVSDVATEEEKTPSNPPKYPGVGEDVPPLSWFLRTFKASTQLGLILGGALAVLATAHFFLHQETPISNIPDSFLTGFLYLFAPRFLIGILARTNRCIRNHLLVSWACAYTVAFSYALIRYLLLLPLEVADLSPLPSFKLLATATISGFFLGVYADYLPDFYRELASKFNDSVGDDSSRESV